MSEPFEPEIITWGRGFIADFSEEDFCGALVDAFAEDQAHYVILDSFPHRQRFLAACAAWAIDAGLLYNDANTNEEQTREAQTRVSSFRLTEKGEQRFLLQPVAAQ